MRYAAPALAILYGLLSAFAAIRQWRLPARQKTSATMFAGGVILIAAAVLKLCDWEAAWLITGIGSLLICQAALVNGKMNGRVKLKHHAVRLCITLFLILGTALT